LRGSGAVKACQGASVALSGDGNTAIIAGSRGSSRVASGAVWFVALSADGETTVVGEDEGATTVFTRVSDNQKTQTPSTPEAIHSV